MKSKEEILKQRGCYEALGDYLLIDHVLESMEEHAKETAIGFAKWLLKNYWQMGDDSYASTEGGEKRWNTKELYELYLKNNA